MREIMRFNVLFLLITLLPISESFAKDYEDYRSELIGVSVYVVNDVPVREYPPRGFFLSSGDKIGRVAVGEVVLIKDVKTYVGVINTDIWVRIERIGASEIRRNGWCFYGADGEKPLNNFARAR